VPTPELSAFISIRRRKTANLLFSAHPDCATYVTVPSCLPFHTKEAETMKIRKKILDYEYEEVLPVKYRELIRVGCAVAVGCPT
jgi:hypothetical protein